MSGLPIGGVQWMTLLDYPGRVAATLFTIGCNYRCPFCHNPELADPERFAELLDEGEILERLGERAGFLDGVVISGGEPTIHPGLPTFIERVKGFGFLVKLDTNGTNPDVLDELLEAQLVDFIAMDVKAPLDRYDEIVGAVADLDSIETSIQRVVEKAPDYEFRTTVAPTLGRDDILHIAGRIAGAKCYTLQAFRVPETGLLDPTWEEKDALSKGELDDLWDEIRPAFPAGGVRG